MQALFIGFGNVGRQVARLLGRGRNRFPGLDRLRLEVVGIVTRHRGSLANPRGVDLNRALAEIEETDAFSPENPDFSHFQAGRAISELDYDVLVELTPLVISDLGQPAVGHVRAAIRRGRHVVTANKGPVAFCYQELTRLAIQNGVQLLFESTVMDGTPIFNMARSGLAGCRVIELAGILNSTSNFVLSRMERGDSLPAAVAEAQAMGIAEADPGHDLEGWDSAAKTCVLANALMGFNITPADVRRQGILSVTPEQIRAAKAEGKRLKLVSRARGAGHTEAAVALESLPASHPFAHVEGTGSVLKISTDLMTPLVVQQESPDLNDTAYGVLSDLFSIQSRLEVDCRRPG